MNKRLINYLSTASTVVLLFACINENAALKLERFVDNAEMRSDSYDAEDWKESAIQYERILKEYSAPGKSYTDAEKKRAAQAIGRYHSLLLKNGIKASASFLEELKTTLPAYLEGLVNGINEDAEDLEKTLESLFDSVCDSLDR